MSIQRQRRRGTAAENAAFTGALGEFTYITDEKRIAAHDGSTAGGTLMPSNRDLINDYFGYAAASGTDTITLTVLAQITAYAAGQQFTFKAAATNTGSATLNVNSIGAKTIKKKDIATGTIAVLEAGDLIIGGMYTVRYDGTDMQLISTDGAPSGAFDHLSTQTASASATIDFTSLITADYESYMFVLKDIRPATNNRALVMRTSTNNGSSYDASASNYQWMQRQQVITAAGATQTLLSPISTYLGLAGEDNSASWGVDSGAGSGISGRIHLFNPLGTVMPKRIVGDLVYRNSTPDIAVNVAGCRDATADVDAVRFLMGSGNITSGKISMYGMKVA